MTAPDEAIRIWLEVVECVPTRQGGYPECPPPDVEWVWFITVKRREAGQWMK